MAEWRNGRRNGLKIRYLYGCEGSSPSSATYIGVAQLGRALSSRRSRLCQHTQTRDRSPRCARRESVALSGDWISISQIETERLFQASDLRHEIEVGSSSLPPDTLKRRVHEF